MHWKLLVSTSKAFSVTVHAPVHLCTVSVSWGVFLLLFYLETAAVCHIQLGFRAIWVNCDLDIWFPTPKILCLLGICCKKIPWRFDGLWHDAANTLSFISCCSCSYKKLMHYTLKVISQHVWDIFCDCTCTCTSLYSFSFMGSISVMLTTSHCSTWKQQL